MSRIHVLLGLLLLTAGSTLAQSAQNTAPDAAVQKRIEDYLRHLYAWGSDVKLTVGALKETGIPGFLETTADVTKGEQKDTARIFVSRDGKYMFRGELSELGKDPLAEVRAKLKIDDAPAKGEPKAAVTLIEFADFQCPVCRTLHDNLRSVLPKYPRARLVFKDFPLSNIHPWARTASIGARCAYEQDPKAFWLFYDKVYDDQQVISAENAWTKMLDYAGQAGLDGNAFKSCMAGPGAAKYVDASFENGREVEVISTPTVFVNGRRMVGADSALLEQYIRYELEHTWTGTIAKKP